MNVIDKIFDFLGAADPPAAGARDGGPWVQTTVQTAGTPLVVAEEGYMKLELDGTQETQLACLHMADELPLDIDKIQQVDFWAKLGAATLPASVSLCFGLASARNNDPDLIAYHALFRAYGTTAVTIDTDDAVHDNDDAATGQVISNSLKRFTMDFASGIRTVSPPPSLGGKANVLFSIDDARNNLQPVARGTTFDMSSYAGGLQLFAQIQKGAASSVGASESAKLLIEKIRVRYLAGA